MLHSFFMENQPALDDIFALRAEAQRLLDGLHDAKRRAEAVLADSPRRDLFKRVTGHSSLDHAIAETRRTLEAYDRLLTERGVPPSVCCISTGGVPSPL